MKVKELYYALKNMMYLGGGEAKIYIGCQGYLTQGNSEDEIEINIDNGHVYITDKCYYSFRL